MDCCLQFLIFLGFTDKEIVETQDVDALDGEVIIQLDAASEEGEGDSLEGIGIEPEGIGEGALPTLDGLHVLAGLEDIIAPAFPLPRGTYVLVRYSLA